jgi:predicted nucleotidyltransferase
MKRAEVITKLKAVEPALRAHGVAALYLFGSYARDEAGPDSDLDVFVDKTPGRKFGFDELMGSYHALCDAIPGIEISYGTRAGLSKYVKNEVEQQAVRIF